MRNPEPGRPPLGTDSVLLRRTARTIALQVAAAVAVVAIAMIAAVLLADEEQQHTQADRVTRDAWSTADDLNDPPDQVWLVIAPGTRSAGSPLSHQRQVSPGAPAQIAGLDPGRLGDGVSRLKIGGRELVAWTGTRGGRRISAVYDLSPQELAERRLVISLVAAALVGVAGAAVIGLVVAQRAVRPLGHALALQRRFVADASHELRTPLSVLQLRAQLLRRRLRDLPPEREADLDRLVHDTRLMGAVVTDLLLSAELAHRPQQGAPVDLRAVAADVVAGLLPVAEDRGVILTLDDEADGRPVQGSGTALRRAISSLVDNALAHTPAEGHVTLRILRDDDGLRLQVGDDGEGLDPARARQLVDRFSRDTGADRGRRFGLGLSLVDEIARAHGGRLEIDGEPGGGATFSLVLPAPAL
jgi:two-component system OmpR family sensor kinase